MCAHAFFHLFPHNPLLTRSLTTTSFDSCSLLADLFSLSLSADPFMYYSIPGIRKAEITLKDVDYSDITSLGRSSSSARQSETQQEAADPSSEGEEDAAIKVSRTSRVSFECHPCVLMEDFITDLEQEFDEEELDRLDDIVTLITSLHKRQ